MDRTIFEIVKYNRIKYFSYIIEDEKYRLLPIFHPEKNQKKKREKLSEIDFLRWEILDNGTNSSYCQKNFDWLRKAFIKRRKGSIIFGL